MISIPEITELMEYAVSWHEECFDFKKIIVIYNIFQE